MIPLLLLCCIAMTSPAHGATVLYPASAGAILSDDYIVKVNGQQVSVYRGINGNSPSGKYSFAYFDFSGTVTVDVTMASPYMKTPIIRPTSKRITYTLNNKTMSFPLSTPANISIEPDHGAIVYAPPLLLFANPLEVNPPKSAGPGVMYYGPGFHTLPSTGLAVPSNTTLYIAGGALLKGRIIPNGSNITVRGRGIVDNFGQYGVTTNRPMFQPKYCTNLQVEGIILKDSGSWTVQIIESSHVTFTNLKIVSTVGKVWHDGIHVVNSNNVTVQDSFILSDDDCIGVSAFKWGHNAPVDTIRVQRSVLWSTGANNWRIGWMAHAPYIRNLTFIDLDVLHRNLSVHNHVVTMQPSGNGTVGTPVSNVRFENIRVDADYGWTGAFIELRPQVWGSNDGSVGPPGRIENVYLKNIFLNGYRHPNSAGSILVSGPAATQYVKDVTFENVVRYGEVTTANSPNVLVTGYTSNIRFVAGTALSATAPTISAQPASRSVTAGQTATFSVVASGTAPLTMQWQKNGVDISAATGTSYTTPATTLADNGAALRVLVRNSVGSVTSQNATLTVTAAATATAPSITTQPTSRSVAAGQTATFSVVASGTAPLAMQWQKNGVNITGATSASYTTPITTTADNGALFRVIVRNSIGSVTSNNATLTVTSTTQLPIAGGTGLTGQYFNNVDFTGTSISRTDATVNFNWDTGSPSASIGVDTFSARWIGQVQPQYSETYTFFVTGDDGVRLWVNGRLLIDKWIIQASAEHSAAIALIANTKYDIKLEYYENLQHAVAQLRWSSASTPKSIIASAHLFPAGSTNVATSLTFTASTDFSGIQGLRQWSYLDSTGTPLVYDVANRVWKGTEPYLWIWSNACHPGASRDVIRRWTSPQAGTISVTGRVRDLDPTGGAGAIAIIRKNGVELWRTTIANGNATGVAFSIPQTVLAGDKIDFLVNRNDSYNYDSTAFDPTIVLNTSVVPAGTG
jgi:hypothetical protein